jgi:hypothetical protein
VHLSSWWQELQMGCLIPSAWDESFASSPDYVVHYIVMTKASTPEVKARPQALAELTLATLYPSLGGFQAGSSPQLPPHGSSVHLSHQGSNARPRLSTLLSGISVPLHIPEKTRSTHPKGLG